MHRRIEVLAAMRTAFRASDFSHDPIVFLAPSVMVHHEAMESLASVVELSAHATSRVAGSQGIWKLAPGVQSRT
jgi:hypothetical protein